MIETSTRKAKHTELKPYCHHSKEHDYMEVTEWSNCEGVDININDEKHISLTWGEFEALQVLINYKE
jgi:hypothetical protein